MSYRAHCLFRDLADWRFARMHYPHVPLIAQDYEHYVREHAAALIAGDY